VKVREGAKPKIHYREFKRDEVPLQKNIPLPLREVDEVLA